MSGGEGNMGNHTISCNPYCEVKGSAKQLRNALLALLLCTFGLTPTVQAAVTATLTSPLANTSVAAPGSFVLTATATSSNSTIKSVAFYNGTKLLKSVTAAPYTYTWSNVAAGTYSLTAKATDKKNATKTSTAVSVKVVANVPPTVSLTSPTINASANAPASFTLAATAISTTSTITNVDFYNGTTLISTATTGVAGLYSFTWNNVAAGTYSLTAKATDAKNAVTTSTAIPVSVVNANVPPTVSLTSPAPNAESTAPATFTLSANAADSDGSISKVEFYNGTTLLGTTTVAPYSYTWNNVAAGNYNLTALATDNTGASSTSSAINVTVNPGEPQVYYIHTDHLDTPREITDTSGNVVWQWDNTDPFGDNPPNENPSGLGQFEFNLRFPGQNYDKETGLHYNYFRDYDPAIGRYVQSDPIGLDGGINGYQYVNSNPLSYTDPTGEFLVPVATGIIGGVAGALGSYINQKNIQGNCNVDWGQVANAGAWGAVAGTLLPFTGSLTGAAAIGAGAGGLQYVTGQMISGSPMTPSGGAIGVATGAAGGAVGGAFTRTVGYGAAGTALPALATQQQTSQAIAANAGVSNLARNIAGGVVGSLDPNASSNQVCGCKK